MDFLEIISAFEKKISDELRFELLEMHYVPYSFGSGICAYRIKGRNIKIVYDGKNYFIEIFVTNKHSNYPCDNWTSIFSGNTLKFLDEGIIELKSKIQDK